MAIVIGDLHGNLRKTKAFLAYKPEEEHVALGDYVDSFTELAIEQIKSLRLLLDSDCELLLGNHELHYLPQRPWVCSGYQYQDAYLYQKMLVPAMEGKRLKAAHTVDGWLCTHAGVNPKIAELIPPEHRNPEAAANWINEEFDRTRLIPQKKPAKKVDPKFYGTGPLFDISIVRGGDDQFGGIFWFDHRRECVAPSPIFKQLFGHTEGEEPEGIPGKWWNLDTTNSRYCWIFDTSRERPERLFL